MTLLETSRRAPTAPALVDAWRWSTPAIAALSCLARVPLIGRPAGPDEAGFMMVASQWAPGRSLYGNYWVDRPPLLMYVDRLAVALGGLPALRTFGLLATAATVLLAGVLAARATRERTLPAGTLALVAPAIVAGAFMAAPEFGAAEIDGEILCAPLVLLGVLALVRAFASNSRRAAMGWALGAGVAAAAVMMIKQNAIDVFLAAAVICLSQVRLRRGDAVRIAGLFATGAVATFATILTLAAMRGTDPLALWDAIFTFRMQAAAVIHHHASAANTARMHKLVSAALISGAPLVLAAFGWQVRKRAASVRRTANTAPDLRSTALVLLAWEVCVIVLGGSFWLHYLLVLVPGLVVLAVAAAQRPASGRVFLAGALTAAVAATGLITNAAAHRPAPDHKDRQLSAYLRRHAFPGDTATVAYGHPNILWDARLASPYEQLWSLPVRVRDPRLDHLRQVLTSPRAPTWLVVPGNSLATWGVDATRADAVMHRRYARVATIEGFSVWQLQVRV